MKFLVAAVLLALCALAQSGPIETDPFIVGGEPADIADFPHSLALLDMVRGGASGYWCGASNIHRFWALTAAHCVHGGTPFELVHLYGGSTSRLSGGRLFFITRYILHPQYNRNTLNFDVALVETDPNYPLEGIPHVTPIAIPPLCTTACCGVCPEGPDVYIAGWGAIETGALPEHLRYVSKGIMTNQQCQPYWGSWAITSNMFCTIVENGRDSCNGDSGSAVVRDGVQVGIVSFGSWPCGDGSAPAVYVRIEEPGVRNWISELAGF